MEFEIFDNNKLYLPMEFHTKISNQKLIQIKLFLQKLQTLFKRKSNASEN